METRRLIVAFLAAMAAFYAWTIIASYIWPRPHPSTEPVASAPAETEPGIASTRPASQAGSTQAAESVVSTAASHPSEFKLVEGTATDAIQLGKADQGFPLELQIQPRGATVAEVKIRGHDESIRHRVPYTIIEPVSVSGQILYSFRTEKIRFENLKLDVPLSDAIWKLSKGADGETVTGTLEVQTQQGTPLARLVKEFHLPHQPAKSPRFDLGFRLAVENLSGQPMRVIVVQQGPVGFRREDLRSEDRTVVGAVWKNQTLTAKGHMRTEVAKKGKIDLGADRDDSRIGWVAEANRYFTCIMTPAKRTNAADEVRFAGVEAIDLVEADGSGADSDLSALTFQYVTTPRDIRAKGTEEIAFDCYIGPKSKKGFDSVPDYALRDYYAVVRQSFYACAPAVLVSLMMWLLDFFHAIVRNYGLAIIMLVLVVRTILHPITKKSQVSMMKMQKQQAVLQPKVEAAKRKFANDKTQLNQEIMKIYQEAGVNPAGSILTCLPLTLQIPIWGALWAALSSTIAMRHAAFDPWWIRDLTSPDALITFAKPVYIPLVSYMMGGPIHSFNLLPILLGISQVLQTKYMPRGAPTAQATGAPDQLEQQRKMMMWMSGVFVLFLYNAPSGLNLYIMSSNFFGILEQWRIRKHIADEEKKLPPPRPPDTGGDDSGGKRPSGGPRGGTDSPRKESWFQRKWRELQKQAEDARRQQSGRDKRSKG